MRKLSNKLFNNSKGAALIAVLGIISLVIVMIQNVSSNAQVEYAKAKNEYFEMKARYHARSGGEVALLRLILYKEVNKMVQNTPASSIVGPYLNLIWSLPFAWPTPIDKDSLKSVQADIQAIHKQSFLQGSYDIKITVEDSKINLNNLSSSIDSVREFSFKAVLNLLSLFLLDNEDLKKEYRLEDLQDLVLNLKDWTDIDDFREQGGSEANIAKDKTPLNRSFFYLEEIKGVPGMTAEIYKLIKPFVTVYGTLGIHVNSSSKEVLQSVFNLPEIVAERAVDRSTMFSSSFSPFSSLEDFCKFLQENSGFSVCEELFKEDQELLKNHIRFNTLLHFQIEVIGHYRNGSSRSEILLYDHFQALNDYKKAVLEHNKLTQASDKNLPKKKVKPNSAQAKESKKENNETKSQNTLGLPSFTIIYWKESL